MQRTSGIDNSFLALKEEVLARHEADREQCKGDAHHWERLPKL
jgi:hypothetical protein